MEGPQSNNSRPEESAAKRAARIRKKKERRRRKIIRFCIAWGSVLVVLALIIVLIVSCSVNAGKNNEPETAASEAVAETETTIEETTTEEETTKKEASHEWDGVTAQEMIDSGAAKKVIFLTFDDGPGENTEELLDILAKYDVKATFFVTNNFPDYQKMIAREYLDGHTVAVHSLTHDYETIYTSEEAYWADFDAMNDIIEAQTGMRSDIFRFPGGSSNTVSYEYREGIMQTLTDQAIEMGYEYVDWDVSSGDGGATADTNEIYNNVITRIEDYDVAVVLMHDSHDYSVNAVEDIITHCLDNGYTFLPFYRGIYTCHHGVNN